MEEEHYLIDLVLLSRFFNNMKNKNAPKNFTVLVSDWSVLSVNFAGCGYKAEIAVNGVTLADYPDIYFDENSLDGAANAGVIAGTADGKIVLYANKIPATALSGAYFIRKGSTV